MEFIKESGPILAVLSLTFFTLIGCGSDSDKGVRMDDLVPLCRENLQSQFLDDYQGVLLDLQNSIVNSCGLSSTPRAICGGEANIAVIRALEKCGASDKEIKEFTGLGTQNNDIEDILDAANL